MSCGSEPPSERYRWRHRVCTQCQGRLKGGAVTWSGSQLARGLQIPSARVGLIRKEDSCYPPSAKKWDSVFIPAGAITYCQELDLNGNSRSSGKTWVPVDKMDIKRFSRPAKVRRSLTFAGIGVSGATPMCSAKCSYNQFKALAGRLFRVPKNQGPCPGVFDLCRRLSSFILPDLQAEPMTDEDWIASMPARRRRALLKSLKLYRRTGWLPLYRKFSAFVKTEMLPDFSKDEFGLTALEEMLDRLINGPHDVTHNIAGKRIKPLAKRLKELWTWQGPIFYGAASPESLHRWLQRLVANPGTYFWCDYSMFDNTHSDESWDFIEELYRKAGIDDPDFWKVMAAWRRPEGSIGPFRYQAGTVNASGRDDTAFANAVLNGFAAFCSACAAFLCKDLLELTVADLHYCSTEIFISVCGDDSLGRLPAMSPTAREQFCKRMSANIAKFGFEAKLMASDRLQDCVYLGCRPYQTRSGWFWGKTIGRALYKMGWFLDPTGTKDPMAHITGIADMHVLCSSHVPILSDVARKIVELRSAAKRTPVARCQDRPWEWTFQSNVQYDDLTLNQVAEAYNLRRTSTQDTAGLEMPLTVDDLRAAIARIRSVRTLPFALDSDVLRRLIWADDL